jgi:hypothetical protein
MIKKLIKYILILEDHATIIILQDVLEEYEERVKKRGNMLKIDPACLKWSPYVPTGVAKNEP